MASTYCEIDQNSNEKCYCKHTLLRLRPVPTFYYKLNRSKVNITRCILFAFGEFLNKRVTYDEFLLNLKALKEKACNTSTQVLEILTALGGLTVKNANYCNKKRRCTQAVTKERYRSPYVDLQLRWPRLSKV